MKKGKIIVIEGTDYSGKTTQYEKLKEKLWQQGVDISSESFPNYASDSSYFVKKYLRGGYGLEADQIDPKAASLFYALDRYDTYKKGGLESVYNNGGNILLSRYITSNILHQASKYPDEEEQDSFISWLYEIETVILGLPREDEVIFLDVPYEYIEKQRIRRNKQTKGLSSAGQSVDIHENDKKHLLNAYKTAKRVAEKLEWIIVECVKDGEMRDIDDIHQEIYGIAKGIYGVI